MRSLCLAILCSLLGTTVSIEPTATQVAEYTYAEALVYLGAAYLQYGKTHLTSTIKWGVTVYKVEYSPQVVDDSTPGDPDAVMAGLLLLPKHVSDTEGAGPLSVVSVIHGTSMQLGPSGSFDGVNNGPPKTGYGDFAVYGGLAAASMGYAVLLPDGLGLGDSSESPYPYCVADGYAISTFNLLAAAKALVPNLTNNVNTIGATMYTAGYSEGGYGAMALHQRSYNAVWATTLGDVTVQGSFPAAGPYDLGYSQLTQSFANAADYAAPSYFAYVGFAYTYFVGVDGVFASDEIAATVKGWFDGSMSRTDIDSKIATDYDSPLDLLSEDVKDAIANGEDGNAFVERLKANSLSRNWLPEGTSFIRMCHGANDNLVFPSNAEAVVEGLDDARSRISYKAVGDSECQGHSDCGPPCLDYLITELNKERKNADPLINSNQMRAAIGVGATLAIVIGAALIWRSRSRSDYEYIA